MNDDSWSDWISDSKNNPIAVGDEANPKNE